MANSKEALFKNILGLNALGPLFSLHLSIFTCFRNGVLSVPKIKYYIFLIKQKQQSKDIRILKYAN